MIRIYFDYGSVAELVATFESEDLFMKCVQALEEAALDAGATLTESMDVEDDE